MKDNKNYYKNIKEYNFKCIDSVLTSEDPKIR